jgi:shikimate dehydrogenase
LLPLLAEQPAELVIVNRTVAKAQELAALAHQHQSGQVPVTGLGYESVQGAFDVVFNATSSSLTAELPPLTPSVFAPGCLAYDLTYGKGLTPFLKLAQQADVKRLRGGAACALTQKP